MFHAFQDVEMRYYISAEIATEISKTTKIARHIMQFLASSLRPQTQIYM